MPFYFEKEAYLICLVHNNKQCTCNINSCLVEDARNVHMRENRILVKRGHGAVTENTQTPKFSARRIIYSGGDKQSDEVPQIRLGSLTFSPQEWFLRRKI